MFKFPDWRSKLKSGFVGILLFLSFQYTIARDLQFPMDDGRHKKADFENWLIFTHLAASDSSSFGIAIFFFTGKIVGLRASGVYVVVADEQHKTYNVFKKIQLPVINRATHTEGRLLEKYGGNILRREPGSNLYEIELDLKEFKLTLSLEPQKAPVDLGQLPVGEEKYNRVYTIPRGKARGKISYDNKLYPLQGIGFFQHQWGDSPDKKTASDLFAFHLQDSIDVLVYHSKDFPQINTMVISGKLDKKTVLQDFEAHTDTTITVNPSGDRFALSWKISAVNPEASFNLVPGFNGQQIEMLGLPYWLSRCLVSGKLGEKTLSGRGYIHLLGLFPGDK